MSCEQILAPQVRLVKANLIYTTPRRLPVAEVVEFESSYMQRRDPALWALYAIPVAADSLYYSAFEHIVIE